MMKVTTCTAPINIAIIKYWGKANDDLIIPLNDSISFTLSQDYMCAKTSVAISPSFKEDRMWLNQKQFEDLRDNARVRRPTAINKKAVALTKNLMEEAYALAKAYGVERELSDIARQGSGSACRSMYGGIVQWIKGISLDGEDSFAIPIAPADHFYKIHVLICVVSDNKKKVGSTDGMKRSVETSPFLQHRIYNTVKNRIKKLLKAVELKDWSTLCDLTMIDSNEMHSVCLNTFPPITYLNDVSHTISHLVHAYNTIKEADGELQQKICYTFDAGPNACIFIPEAVISEVMSLFLMTFPSESTSLEHEYVKGMKFTSVDLPESMKKLSELNRTVGCLKYFIHTCVGDGPRHLLDPEDHLLNIDSGLPLFNTHSS